MTKKQFLDDTITRRLIVTVALAAGVTLLLLELFFLFGGRWTKPDIQETGLPGQVATVIRMTEAAPAASRAALAQAAATDQLRFGWYAPGSPIAKALREGEYRATEIDQAGPFSSPIWPAARKNSPCFKKIIRSRSCPACPMTAQFFMMPISPLYNSMTEAGFYVSRFSVSGDFTLLNASASKPYC
ncbi:hypothetical protein [Asaia platycodi]|uniref:hypothetical protein n=1 Tax=Asaia platycodi TaxID=610243 RepID=UPI000A7BA246|nr:hypothetical protein [Asaia platycodi]